MAGKLYLIPVGLGEGSEIVLPEYLKDKARELNCFITERARTGRRFISSLKPGRSIQEMTFFELDKREPAQGIDEMLQPALQGTDTGLMSEAGCPGVADPGALVVARAHKLGIEVVPIVGPSSILLALMGSGMSGQKFAFKGYLPIKSHERSRAIKSLEKRAISEKETQIFIETPYRNVGMLEDLLKNLSPSTKICIATDLTLPSQSIKTKSAQEWKKTGLPDINKRPTVFLIYM